MGLTYVRYEADGWGVGELVLDGGRLLHSELPRPGLQVTKSHKRGHALAERLRAYFAGARVEFADVEVALDDETEFGRRLAAAMRAIPYGEVASYGELALDAGRPRAARAAGSFCARCALAPVLPVHRVVGAAGIGGFGSLGVDYKRRLLELEGVAL